MGNTEVQATIRTRTETRTHTVLIDSGTDINELRIREALWHQHDIRGVEIVRWIEK